MSDPTTFERVPPEASNFEELSSETNRGVILKGNTSPWDQWVFTGLWIPTAILTVVLLYGIGVWTGTHGRMHTDWGLMTSAVWGGAWGAPFGILGGLLTVYKRRRVGGSLLLHYSVLLVAAGLTFGVGFIGSLPVYLILLASSPGLQPLVLGGMGTVLMSATAVLGLGTGAHLLRGQIGRRTLTLLALWLVSSAAIQLVFADPTYHLFWDLFVGGGGALLLVFAASRPIYNHDRIKEGWPARLRYYGGALLFTMGTLSLFVLGEGLMTWLVG